MSTLHLVRGLPGSGKTTFAKSLAADLGKNAAHFEADQYFTDQHGVYNFVDALKPVAHAYCLYLTSLALGGAPQGRLDVVVSNTFTRKFLMQPYVDLAKHLGAKCVIHTCVGRYPNVHEVPDAVLEKMYVGWEALPEEWKDLAAVWPEPSPDDEMKKIFNQP